MDFQYLYTKTEGRISRKTWWIGALVLAVANIIISLLILPVFGLGAPNVKAILANQTDPVQSAALITSAFQTAGWGSLVIFLIFAYPGYCLSVKRRHDKNNSGRDVLIYFAVTALLLLVQALGLGYTVGDVAGVPEPTVLFYVIGVVVGIFGLYLLVVLGFLKGTDGTNDYGPDPLISGAAAAA